MKLSAVILIAFAMTCAGYYFGLMALAVTTIACCAITFRMEAA